MWSSPTLALQSVEVMIISCDTKAGLVGSVGISIYSVVTNTTYLTRSVSLTLLKVKLHITVCKQTF